MSWKPEVRVARDPNWYSNAIRFETEAEAIAAAKDLLLRWTMAVEFRASESDDPVNRVWTGTRSLPLEQ